MPEIHSCHTFSESPGCLLQGCQVSIFQFWNSDLFPLPESLCTRNEVVSSKGIDWHILNLRWISCLWTFVCGDIFMWFTYSNCRLVTSRLTTRQMTSSHTNWTEVMTLFCQITHIIPMQGFHSGKITRTVYASSPQSVDCLDLRKQKKKQNKNEYSDNYNCIKKI